MSLNPKKVKIRILNPVAGCGFTSLAHARRYIRRGAAIWADDKRTSIVMDTNCHQRVSAEKTVRRPVFTDGTGMATLDAVQGLPVCGPAVVLFYGKSARKPTAQ